MSGILPAMASSSFTIPIGRVAVSYLFVLSYTGFGSISSLCKRIDELRSSLTDRTEFNTSLRRSAFTKMMVAGAFALTSNVNSLDLIPAKLKTALLSLSVFNRISQSPVGHFLTSPHALVLTPLVIEFGQYLRIRYDAKQKGDKKIIACDLLGKVGHLFSCAALAKLTLVAFTNIGTWKQGAGSLALLGASCFAGVIINQRTEANFNSLTLPAVITVAFGILGKVIKQVSWIPQANINVATVIIGALAYNNAYDELTA